MDGNMHGVLEIKPHREDIIIDLERNLPMNEM